MDFEWFHTLVQAIENSSGVRAGRWFVTSVCAVEKTIIERRERDYSRAIKACEGVVMSINALLVFRPRFWVSTKRWKGEM
jgi:hypothetical protein